MRSAVGLLPIAAIAAVLSLLATPAVRNVAVRLRLLDAPADSRRVHGRPVPRLGGVAIVGAFVGALAIGLVIPGTRATILGEGWALLALGIGGLIVASAGLYDDLIGATARKKLLVEFTAGVVLYMAGFRLVAIDNPFGEPIQTGILSFPLTLLWLAGVANALNLVDGLDGLAAGIALVGSIAAFVLGVHAGDAAAIVTALALAGAVAGFLAYNVAPASIFMGDVGSLFLGTILAALALRPPGGRESPSVVATAVVLGVPLLDTVLAIVRRAARGAPLFSADREHIHHRLVDRERSSKGAVRVLWSTSAVLGAAGLAFAIGSVPLRAAVFCAVVAAALVLLSALGYVAWPGPGLRSRRVRNRERLRAIREVSIGLRGASSVRDVTREVARAAAALDAESVRLHSRASRARSAHGEHRRSAGERVRSTFPLRSLAQPVRALEVLWSPTAGRPDRDVEVAIEILCRHVSEALARIELTGAALTMERARERSRGEHGPASSRNGVIHAVTTRSGHEAEVQFAREYDERSQSRH